MSYEWKNDVTKQTRANDAIGIFHRNPTYALFTWVLQKFTDSPKIYSHKISILWCNLFYGCKWILNGVSEKIFCKFENWIRPNAECRHAKYHCAECHCAECHYAVVNVILRQKNNFIFFLFSRKRIFVKHSFSSDFLFYFNVISFFPSSRAGVI